MRGLNKVILIGNAGKQPDLKKLADGTPVANFSLATTESYRTKNGDLHTATDWHTIIAWRYLATFAGEYIRAGSLVYIEGKLRSRNYVDKQNHKIYVTEIYAEQIILLDKKPKFPESIDETITIETPPF